tara:strand:+ start:85 stop:351 length:267 start_codon:yes stop_codon:yes gene_type:complete
MKFSKLRTIIMQEVNERKESAGYSGSWTDGGSSSLKTELDFYKMSLVKKHDLRPSEWGSLDNVEVGEPSEFSSEIEKYKTKLARNIKL